jgi:hypothetical protein
VSLPRERRRAFQRDPCHSTRAQVPAA